MTIIDDLVSGWLETYAVLSKASRRSALAIGIGLSLLPVFNAGVLAVVLPGSWYLPLSQEDKDKGKTELMHASSFGDVERVREL
jgi:hypothetical protein